LRYFTFFGINIVPTPDRSGQAGRAGQVETL